MAGKRSGLSAVVALALALGCSQGSGPKGDKGDEGPQGPQGAVGPAGPAGTAGAGWADAGADIVSTVNGNVGIGTTTPVAKLDVKGSVNASQLLFEGTEVPSFARSGYVTDLARNRPVTVTGGTLAGAGPTNELALLSLWRTTVFPSSMTVDFGQVVNHVFQVAWESYWRTDSTYNPEWTGTGAYVLEYSENGTAWTAIPSVAPVGGDMFVHAIPPGKAMRYLRLTVKAPRTAGNQVQVTLFRALSLAAGDSSAIDARRVVMPAGSGPTRVWGQGRPGVSRFGLSGVESGLCVNGAVKIGMSNVRVIWEGSAAGCPAGSWVCTQAERGNGACDTTRPDTTCDWTDRQGICHDEPPSGNWGHVADNGFIGGTEGVHVNENGTSGAGGIGNASMPVWCCSY